MQRDFALAHAAATMAPALELFPFRYRGPGTGKWIMACYVAERSEIAARYAESETTSRAEIRDVDANARVFSSQRNLATRSHLPVEEPLPSDPPQPETEPGKAPPVTEPPDTDPPVTEPTSDEPAALEGIAPMLLPIFLRRHIGYCARRGRFAAMNGAARLIAELRASASK